MSVEDAVISEAKPTTLLPNRAQRRKNLRPPLGSQGNNLVNDATQIGAYVSSYSIEENHPKYHNLTERVFRSPTESYRFLDIARRIPSILKKINSDQISPDKAVMANLNLANIFPEKINGLSLFDLEDMDLPLSSSNIKKINKMMKHFSVVRKLLKMEMPPPKPTTMVAMQALIRVASKQFAQTERKFIIPESAKKVTNVAIAYFDYYTNLFLNPLEDFQEERAFLLNTASSSHWLMAGLSCFIPARLGITPSSSIKLFEERQQRSLYANDFSSKIIEKKLWNPIIDYMKTYMFFAYRKNNLPQDLERFQHYDEQLDLAAQTLTRDFYRDKIDPIETKESAIALKGRLKSYREKLLSDISHKRLNLDLPDNHMVRSVSVAGQNKDVMIFILHFRDSSAHLTLELGKGNRLFGFPAKLRVERPELQDQVLTDILEPFLEKARIMYPNIESVRIIRDKVEVIPQTIPEIAVPKKYAEIPKEKYILPIYPEKVEITPRDSEAKPKEKKVRKMQQILTPIQFYLQMGANPPEARVIEELVPTRIYHLTLGNDSDRAIEEFIYKQANKFARRDQRMQRDLQGVLSALSENPYGPGCYKIKGSNFRSFRADQAVELEHPETKRLRIIFHLDGASKDNIIIDDILHHNEFDKKFSGAIRF